MKVFIISMAIVLLAVTMLSFTTDMDRYMRLQKQLKNLSEDCANAAALCLDTNELEVGNTVIDPESANEQLSFLTDKISSGSIDYEMLISGSAVTVKLHYSCSDIFRLPFITVTDIYRSSCYEWK